MSQADSSQVLFSLFKGPRAGLATVLGSFFGLATNTLNVRTRATTNDWLFKEKSESI